MVLPLFFLGMLTMISFMDLYQLQTEKLMALCEHTKEAGMLAYVLDESGPSEITLPDVYTYQPIGGWFPLPKIWICNTVTVHAWTGKEDGEDGGEGDEQEPSENMVYLAETGTVYHVDPECTYLDLSIRITDGHSVRSLTNNYGEHYTACRTCSKHQSPTAQVYITKTGTSYHNLDTCSALKRTVRLVPESQVEGMHVCSRCGGKESTAGNGAAAENEGENEKEG